MGFQRDSPSVCEAWGNPVGPFQLPFESESVTWLTECISGLGVVILTVHTGGSTFLIQNWLEVVELFIIIIYRTKFMEKQTRLCVLSSFRSLDLQETPIVH